MTSHEQALDLGQIQLWSGTGESKMLEQLHNTGLKSEHCYLAGMVSVGVAFASWLASRRLEHAGIARADRWGIFIGEWAPTFFAMGNGLRTYEK